MQALIYAARCKKYPHLRRPGIVGIIRNGGVKRVYECCVCGTQHSMDARWPKPKHVLEFIKHHKETCGKQLVLEVFGKEKSAPSEDE